MFVLFALNFLIDILLTNLRSNSLYYEMLKTGVDIFSKLLLFMHVFDALKGVVISECDFVVSYILKSIR